MGAKMTIDGIGYTTTEGEEAGGGLISTEDVYLASQTFTLAHNAAYTFHVLLSFGGATRDIYARIQANLEGSGTVELFEDPTLIPGLPGGVFNILNSSTGRIMIPNIIANSNPGVTTNGTSILQKHIGASQPGVIGPTYLNTRAHEYIIEVTNQSGAVARGSLELSWSEVA